MYYDEFPFSSRISLNPYGSALELAIMGTALVEVWFLMSFYKQLYDYSYILA